MAFGPKVLLTGANGYIASQILLDLLKANYKVIGTVRSNSKIQEMISWNPTIKSAVSTSQLTFDIVPSFVVEDAWDSVLEIHQGIDYVLHTASPFTAFAKDFLNDLIEPAVKGTKYLLQSVHKHSPSVKRVVVTSSFASVADGKNPSLRPGYTYTSDDWQTLDYEDGVAPRETSGVAYLYSKKAAELAAWEFMKEVKPKFDLVALCPPLVFGPPVQPMTSLTGSGMSTMRLYNWLRAGFEKSPEQAVWLWVDVRDLSTAHLRAMEVKEAGGKRFLITEGNCSYVQMSKLFREKFPEEEGKGLVKKVADDERDYPEGGVYGADNGPSKEILGLTYLPVEKCVEDTGKRILEVEKILKKGSQ